MSNVVITAFAVALLLALFELPIEVLSVYMKPKPTNFVISVGLSYLGIFLLGSGPIQSNIVKSMASAFLSRASLTLAERIATYRPSSVREV